MTNKALSQQKTRYAAAVILLGVLLMLVLVLSPAPVDYENTQYTYNDDGTIATMMFYDASGKQVQQSGGYYGIAYSDYDDSGRALCQTFLDKNGKPFRLLEGYSTKRTAYYKDGRLKSYKYYDTEGKPAQLDTGEYGTLYTDYDDMGLYTCEVCLDADGNEAANYLGYSRKQIERSDDFTVTTTWYLNSRGENVAARDHGEYGSKTVNGKTTLIDSEGRGIFVLSIFLGEHVIVVVLIALILVIVAALLKSRRLKCLILIAYMAFIIYMTFVGRAKTNMIMEPSVFWSYKQFFAAPSIRLEIIKNVLFFVPLGAILCKIKNDSKILLIAVLTTIGIELAQYMTHLGMCEIDDIVSNSLGALIGFMLCRFLVSSIPPHGGHSVKENT